MIIDSVVYAGADRPLERERLHLAAPGPGLVRVDIRATGVCHSDLRVVDGDWATEAPLVLGHEGAGVVTAVGTGVERVRVGDPVALSWFAPCRRCIACNTGRPWVCTGTSALDNSLPDGSHPVSREDGSPVPSMLGLGTFAQATVVPETAVVPLPAEVPLEVAALIGCSVATGVGAVINTSSVRPGQSAVVLGCGGVGQAIVMGLQLAGAGTVIAVDLSDERLQLCSTIGATHVLRGDRKDLGAEILRLTHGGADAVFEAIGNPATIELMPSLLRAGGEGILVGMSAHGTQVRFDSFDLADRSITLRGCNYGSTEPTGDFPRLAALYRDGRLPLDSLIGRVRPMSEVHEAFGDLRDTVGLRTVLVP